MHCLLCGSGNPMEFSSEMMIHFSGLKHVDKPGVWLFPKLVVCLDCGAAWFRVPEKALASLACGAPAGKRTDVQGGGDEVKRPNQMAFGAGQ
jgi:hypothetical protein